MSSVNSIFHDVSSQGIFLNSLNVWRFRNRRIFELHKSVIYHEKALEKIYPMMLFSKTSIETLPSKHPKNKFET